ncbi:glycosyltransferase [Flavobacteriaceae bacterium]|nr:glycosyltransferase [Flavobacteriaceae bacterium]
MIKKAGLVSIVLPVYNGANYLKTCLESILSQSYRQIEILIVDDGSTDNTEDIIEDYRKLDSRIRYLKNRKNLGLPKSLNIGIKSCKGEYVTWTSHDNIYYSTAISVMVRELERNQMDFVYCDCEVIDELENTIGLLKAKPAEHLLFGNVVFHCWLHKRHLHDQVGFYDENLVLIEDYDFMLRIAKQKKMMNIEKVLYKHRFHNASLTHAVKNHAREKMIFEQNKIKMFEKLLIHKPTNHKKTMDFLMNPYEAIYNSIKSHELNLLFTEYKNLTRFFKYFSVKRSTRLFCWHFFDIARRNKEFHRISLIKILYCNSKIWSNLSAKQNLVLVKKALLG